MGNLQYIIRHTIKMPEEKSKAEIIAERVANLPLPEDPPVASDWNSANANTVNVKAGERQAELPNSEASDTGLEGAATKGSGVRQVETDRSMPNPQVQPPCTSWTWFHPHRVEGSWYPPQARTHNRYLCRCPPPKPRFPASSLACQLSTPPPVSPRSRRASCQRQSREVHTESREMREASTETRASVISVRRRRLMRPLLLRSNGFLLGLLDGLFGLSYWLRCMHGWVGSQWQLFENCFRCIS